jgi:hypothetical protein
MATATYSFSGGVTASVAWGELCKFQFYGTWAVGDTWTIKVTSTSGDFTLGAGYLKDNTYAAILTYDERVYIAGGAVWNFSAIDDPTEWEEQSIGAGKVSFRTAQGALDSATGLAALQNRVYVFGRNTIQGWSIDANPDNFALTQILQNIGTVSGKSIQSVGDMDVFFLDNTGIRSLRSKEMTLNASPVDAGSPVDELVQADLLSLTDAQKAACVGLVEPDSRRYWLAIQGTLYVFSNYPQSKISAWSTYKSTYQTQHSLTGVTYNSPSDPLVAPTATISGLTAGRKYEWIPGSRDVSITDGTTTLTARGEIAPTGTTLVLTGNTPGVTTNGTMNYQTSFVVDKMVVYQNKIYLRSTVDSFLLVYGGTDNATYDCTVATCELPWMDFKKPSLVKRGLGVDAVFTGAWRLSSSMNPRATSYVEVIKRGSVTSPSSLTDSTFDLGRFSYNAIGTHTKLKAESLAVSSAATLSSLVFLYDEANVK